MSAASLNVLTLLKITTGLKKVTLVIPESFLSL